MSRSPFNPEFVEQVIGYLEGGLDDAAVARLSDRLAGSPEQRDQFAVLCHVISMIARRGEALYDEPAEARHVQGARRFPPGSFDAARGWLGARGLAAAAALLIVVGVAALYLYSVPRSSSVNDARPRPVASVVDFTDTVYVDDQLAHRGDAYRPGSYAIEAGSAELLLSSGVAVTLSGRTSLEIRSDRSTVLRHGTGTFDCPPAAKGFAVELPHGARVVDLGTRFRVSVERSGDARVEVLEGRVELTRGGTERFMLSEASSAHVPGDPTRHIVATQVPAVLAGASLWLKADAIAGIADGEVVSTWTGSSRQDHTADAAGTERPTYVVDGISGRPAVRFDGKQRMSIPTSGRLGMVDGDCEVFIVAQTDRPVTQFLLATDGSQGHERFEMHLNHPQAPAGFNFIPRPGVRLAVGRSGEFVGRGHVFFARIIDGQSFAGVDVAEASAEPVPAAGPRADLPLVLGQRGNGNFPLVGDIAEVLIFDFSLTDEQRVQVLAYLNDKYGFADPTDKPPISGDSR